MDVADLLMLIIVIIVWIGGAISSVMKKSKEEQARRGARPSGTEADAEQDPVRRESTKERMKRLAEQRRRQLQEVAEKRRRVLEDMVRRRESGQTMTAPPPAAQESEREVVAEAKAGETLAERMRRQEIEAQRQQAERRRRELQKQREYEAERRRQLETERLREQRRARERAEARRMAAQQSKRATSRAAAPSHISDAVKLERTRRAPAVPMLAIRSLSHPVTLRDGMILREILDKPLALRGSVYADEI